MIHKFSVILELTFDDEDGEYAPPSLKEINTKISNAIWPAVQHMGFEKEYEIEAAKGNLNEAFGI